MGNVFEAYRKHYQNKSAEVKVSVVVLDGGGELFPEYVKETEDGRRKTEVLESTKVEDAPVYLTNYKNAPEHVVLLQQIMQEESRVREFRELLRCKYYHLEDKKAPIKDFAANHAAITKCTKELQDLYIKRKHIELHQRLPDVRHMMSDEDQALVRDLKYQRRTIVDKMGKLTKKIDTYLSKPNGVQLRPKWENELEYAQLKLLELDRKIDGINGLA